MSGKKQVKEDGTNTWWGYTTQVNLGSGLAVGNVVKQFMTLKNMDTKYNKETLINFYC